MAYSNYEQAENIVEEHTFAGFIMLIFGAMEFFNELLRFTSPPVDTLPWLANPLLAIALFCLLRKWFTLFYLFSICSIYFASLYIGNPVGFCCEDGRHIPAEIRFGYWIWLLSLIVFLYQGLIRFGGRRLNFWIAFSTITLIILSLWSVGLFLSKPERTNFYRLPAHAENAQFFSKSNRFISGWFIKSPEPKAVALLMHGVRSNRGQMLNRAQHFRNQNITSLVFDFQAHGMSHGNRITMGSLESQDATAAIEYIKEIYPDLPLIVVGVSLGGASMLLSEMRSAADVLILESVYTDLDTATANRLNMHLPGMDILVPFFMLQFKLLTGENGYSVSPLNKAIDTHSAVLVLNGEDDTRATINDARKLFEQFPGPKEFVTVPKAGHVDLEKFNPDFYWSVVNGFLEKHIDILPK